MNSIKKVLYRICKDFKLKCLCNWRRLMNSFVDEQSIATLEACEKYRRNDDRNEFITNIANIYKDHWRLEESVLSEDKIAIWGYGDVYNYTRSLFDNSNYSGNVNYVGSDYDSLKSLGDDTFLLVACDLGDYINQKNRISKLFPNLNFIELEYGICVGERGNQYFDYFKPLDHEIIVDAGAFNGDTEVAFYTWGKESIDKIYAFELDPRNARNCIDCYNINGLQKVSLIAKGTGRKDGIVFLDDNKAGTRGSHAGQKDGVQAGITTIDSVVGSESVTYIKMDVEGAELDSLIGASETIKNNKPRLAICIYHKDEDAYVIPRYLKKLVPEYRFAVRHYTSISWETVLYAFVDK